MNRHIFFGLIGGLLALVVVMIIIGHNRAEAPLLSETESNVITEGDETSAVEITPPTDKPDPQPLPIGNGETPLGCVIGGCSGQLCVEAGNEMMTTCEWRAEYACYKKATCERQSSGECGWTDTPALQQCLIDSQSPEAVVELQN